MNILGVITAFGSLYPQAIVWNGILRSGLLYYTTDSEDEDAVPTISAYNTETTIPVRVELLGNYNYGGDYGFGFKLTGDFDGTPPAGRPSSTWIGTAFGWLRAFDGILTLYGGNVDAGPFRTDGGIDYSGFDGDLNAGPGIMAVVNPVYNLNIGGSAYANGFNGDSWRLAQYNFHVSYEFTDVLQIITGVRSHQFNSANHHDTAAYVGLKVSALKDYGFSAMNFDFFGFNLGEDFIRDKGSIGTVTTGQKIIFSYFRPFEAGIRFRERFYMGDQADDEEYSPDLNFWVWVRYPVLNGKLLPKLDAVYIRGSNPRNNIFKPEDLRWDSHNKYRAGFMIRPSAEICLWVPNNTLEIGYTFIMDISRYYIDPLSRMDHAVFANYRVSF